MNLNELPLNTIGIIDSLNCNGNIRRRMLDLGLINGTKIIFLKSILFKIFRAFPIFSAVSLPI